MYPGEFSAVLTAAGQSSRMGRPKALLEWRGLPLIAHQVKALSALGEVIVVIGHEAHILRPFIPVQPNVRVIENLEYASGRTSSLKAGFKAISGNPRALVVVAVDQPLTPAVLNKLMAEKLPASAVAVPVFQGKRGHPVLFRGNLLEELRNLADEGEGLRDVVSRYAEDRQEIFVDDPGIFTDLNLPLDYLQAQAARSPFE